MTKNHFCMPQTFDADLHYLHTIYRLHFGPNLVLVPRYLDNKL